uniref:Uncharacterized protein n=2 Tax=Physcomitrium patens TaxID=3218 RepID=A0A2K1J7S5_PHYPA|nr:protein WEAK CHLOROPLAST MOVEMENT UNDER BLUE LIGHT-like 1 isoform X1 [Physcomitrium patens]PNR37569.1 hypothetical protein PHYPA_020678 [Physcomitrium patens]|eukprot:XP_024398560.1 protein WEAK CHLOROPLAST MOVEMENT UNDER BLUE LIGHT-like 1 isoform X1 [Physcomitrella patens]
MNSFRYLQVEQRRVVMAEPKVEVDQSAPFSPVEAADSMVVEKIPEKTQPLSLSHSADSSSLQYAGTYHATNPQVEKPYALENEFSRAHAEINNKQQLPASEAAKTEGMKQSTSLPILAGLDWQHHLDAVLGPQRTALVPSTESSEANTNHGMEIDRLQKELENANSQYLELSAELESARAEMNRLRQGGTAANMHGTELEIAKQEIIRLQAASWSQHGAYSTELARAKDEIVRLQSELRGVKISSTDLSHAKELNSLLLADIEASAIDLTKTNEELRNLRGQYEHSMSEINRLQAQQRSAVAELNGAKDEINKLQTDLTSARSNSAGELLAAREQIEKLRAELDSVQGQSGSSSTELINAKQKILNLEGQLQISSTHLGGYASQLTIAKEEINRLQNELSSLHQLHGKSSSELTVAREQLGTLQLSQESRDISSVRLSNVGNESTGTSQQIENPHSENGIAPIDLSKEREENSRLRDELSAASKQIQELKDEVGRLQADLMVFQFESPELLKSREEIERLRVQIQQLSDSHPTFSSREVDNGDLVSATLLDELTMELMTTNEHLEKATQARMNVERELAAARVEAEEAGGLRVSLESLQAEFKVAKEAERKLADVMTKIEGLKSQLAVTSENEERTSKIAADANEELLSLNTALGLVRESEQELSKLVDALRLEVKSLKAEMVVLKESEGKMRESYVATKAELEKVAAELEKVKEAEERATGVAASTGDELDALTEELRITKEGEARAKAAFTDYSLKLQRMRIELEDATKLAEKARAFKFDLDEANIKLKKLMESERSMSATMASLRAEVGNANAEIARAREEGEAALAEKESDIEMEMSRMKTEWGAAVAEEKRLKEESSALSKALTKVTDEKDELKSTSASLIEELTKAKQDLKQVSAKIETLETKLQAALLEVEAVKASEERALSQVKVNSYNPDVEVKESESGAEVTIPSEEYQALKTSAKEVEELANKRVALSMAQVEAAKASEKEMQSKLEMAKKDIEASRAELIEAMKKRDEAEAAKFAVEGMLRTQRGQGRYQAFNGGPPMGSPSNGMDRQGYMLSPASGNSQNSSPLHPTVPFSFPTPPRLNLQEKIPSESLANVLATQLPLEEKKSRPRFSSKIGSYFGKKKDSGSKKSQAV